ncbi:PHD finger protein 20-like protein 1 isoform X2 [Ananas comosus]|uniref:PHD finger protein 20-like protein 1 isoform X2 n=1 Tax=Ananas comosus TaxID=4615 RepID=A0A6P5FJR7_ANACO|nr:PHD finger protein 20-like protein 1 isoform X2 [Ananas comosus]
MAGISTVAPAPPPRPSPFRHLTRCRGRFRFSAGSRDGDGTSPLLKIAVGGVTELLRVFSPKKPSLRQNLEEEQLPRNVEDVIGILEIDFQRAYFLTAAGGSDVAELVGVAADEDEAEACNNKAEGEGAADSKKDEEKEKEIGGEKEEDKEDTKKKQKKKQKRKWKKMKKKRKKKKGNFTADIYAEDCLFEDPTIRFRGRDLYSRNLDLLVPFFDCPSLELEAIEKAIKKGSNYEINFILATWKLRTYLKFPWRPLIAIGGQTTYDLGKDFKIIRHAESWNISALEAIGQIFTLASRDIDS